MDGHDVQGTSYRIATIAPTEATVAIATAIMAIIAIIPIPRKTFLYRF